MAGRAPTWVAIALPLWSPRLLQNAPLVVPVVVIALLLVTSRKQPWRSRSTWTRLLVLLGHTSDQSGLPRRIPSRFHHDKGQGGEPGLSDAVIKAGSLVQRRPAARSPGRARAVARGNGPYPSRTRLAFIVVALIGTVLLVGAVVRRPGGLRTAAPVLWWGAAYAVPILVMISRWRPCEQCGRDG